MAKKITTVFIILFCAVTAVWAATSSGGNGDHVLSSYMSHQTQDFLFKCFNFALLLYLLHKFARKPIANMLSSIAINTKDTMDSAEAKLKEAETKLAEYRQKIANPEKETVEMQERSLKVIEKEKKKLIDEAKETAQKIERQTQVRIEQDVLKAKMEVRAFLVSESVKMAEKLLAGKTGSREHKQLISNYTHTIREIASN